MSTKPCSPLLSVVFALQACLSAHSPSPTLQQALASMAWFENEKSYIQSKDIKKAKKPL